MPLDRTAFPRGYRIIDARDPFETAAGPFYAPEDRSEPLRVLLRAEAKHCNASGVIHGGMLTTMADVTLCAQAVWDNPEERAVTVSLTSDFVDAGREGDFLEARAEIVRRTGSLVFARGRIAADGRTVLTCSAVIKRVRRG